MKKKILGVALACVCALGVLGLAGCGGSSSSSSGDGTSGTISVYSREDGSGTRGAFVELFGIEEEDSSGEKVDMTTSAASITNSTSVMMTSISGDPNGIGYISLGSLNDTVKAVSIDGVMPSATAVKDGSYTVARPFNIITGSDLSETAQDFIDFIMSSDGQAVVEENGYISVSDAAAYTGSGVTGKVTVAGSSSVTPVMEKLAEAYKEINPDVTIEVQQSDSTTGVQMATEGTCDIGMASRELKSSEEEGGVSATVIAQDGIAVIVNVDSTIEDLTKDQVKGIFTGDVTDWADIASADSAA